VLAPYIEAVRQLVASGTIKEAVEARLKNKVQDAYCGHQLTPLQTCMEKQ
jgi:hypothetical protein